MNLIKFLLIICVFQFGFSQSNNFGKPITNTEPISVSTLTGFYEEMNPGDEKKITAKVIVNEVCQVKGCWLSFILDNGEMVRVKFKDYAFFVPKDTSGKAILIQGIAGVEEQSVSELRHYAQDAGKSQEEVDKINQPKQTKVFLANGVSILN